MSASWRLAILSCAVLVGLLAWFSGPPAYDLLDGTEFVICAREMSAPHPPGYPLFTFLLRSASEAVPCAPADYGFFRTVTSIFAGLAFLAGAAAMMSFGVGAPAAMLGSLMFFTMTPILKQTNIVEVHGFAMLLAAVALAVRHSRCGPYTYALSLFGGHPLSLFLLPAVATGRFRQRWVLLTAVPATLILFPPIRSMLPSLVGYDKPYAIRGFVNYFSTYSGYFNLLVGRAADALLYDMKLPSMIILAVLLFFSRRFPWRLLTASLLGFLFLSFYAISDTGSMLWIVLLPLAIWASLGVDRLLEQGRSGTLLVLLLVGASVFLGTAGAWRADDAAADTISRDCLRGIAPGGVYITIGFNTFCTAYLLEVEDMRPDLQPMDATGCYFGERPPKDYPTEMNGAPVYTNRGWDRPGFQPHGILFSADSSEVDWWMYDLFWLTEGVRDGNARDLLADIWVIRGMQTADSAERALIWSVAQNWTWSDYSLGLVNNRIAQYYDR